VDLREPRGEMGVVLLEVRLRDGKTLGLAVLRPFETEGAVDRELPEDLFEEVVDVARIIHGVLIGKVRKLHLLIAIPCEADSCAGRDLDPVLTCRDRRGDRV